MARRILTEFVMDKIAAVDRPCQEHATVTIMKRAPDVVKAFESDEAAMEALRSLAMLRTSVLKAKVRKAMLIEGFDGPPNKSKKKPKAK